MLAETLKHGFKCRPFSRQERLRRIKFNNPSMIHKRNLIKIKDRVEFVRNGNDSLVFEVGANNLLHELICLRVHTKDC